MDYYKKLIRSQRVRMRMLKLMSFVPDQAMICLQYWIKMHRLPDLKKPTRYTEKIQWYKLNYRDPLMTQCVDKYWVREYIASKGYNYILTKLYGVYANPDEIDFNQLPNRFILKTTNESGTNIICTEKMVLDESAVRKELRVFMNRPRISAGREWAYYHVQNRIVAEELLEDKDNPFGGINDYKFFCFQGKIAYVQVDVGRFGKHMRNIYDANWNLIHVTHGEEQNYEPIGNEKDIFNCMKPIVEDLASDFPAVRVDLYYVDGKVYFGELTFYSFSGYMTFHPDSFDIELGEKFILPQRRV